MRTTLLRAGALACALMTSSALTAPALAQTVNPRFSQVDGNGVDVVTGQFNFAVTEGNIGSGAGALTLTRYVAGANAASQWTGLLYRRTSSGTPLMYVEFGNIAETFTISGSTYTSTLTNGGTLVSLGSGQYRYTSSDGTQILYDNDHQEPFDSANYIMNAPACQVADAGTCAIPITVTRPNGMTFTMGWDIHPHCDGYDEELNCINPTAFFRPDGVTSSGNYSFSLGYATDNPGGFSVPVPDWYKRTTASFTNLASAPSPLPSSSYAYPSSGVYEMTDTGGRTWRITSGGGSLGIRRPGSSSDDITVTYSSGYVSQVVRDGVTTTYARNFHIDGVTLTTTITAGGNSTVYVSNLTTGRITTVTDPLNRTTSFSYDGNGRTTRVTRDEGNYTEYTYDSRGNVTETRMRDKAGNSANDIVTEADFPSTCTNVVTCNRPTATRDALDRQTDYSWDSTHGGLLTVTPPAPGGSGTRPQTRYTYTQVTAMTGQPVYLPTNISACQTTASCNGQADEVETNVTYNTSNLLPTSVASGSGNGTLTATMAATYDSIGNLLTIDGPLSGTADTTRYRYNASRQVVGVIGPDPDGGGSLKHRAVRTTYDGGGRPTDVEYGTVNSQSDGDWAAMSVLQEVEQDYDANHRPVVQRLESGGTAYALTQTSYDSLGRVRCVTQRMNPGEYGSLPTDNCTLDNEGSYGPDRITRTSYDVAGQVTLVETGVGVTGVAADEVTTAYTDNGRVHHVTDANGNRTTYEYDGHDRLVTTRMPDPSTPETSSTTDYEQLTLDANGNVTNRQLRDTTSIAYSYDNLNRLTTKDLPGSEATVTYTYDLLGRLLTAAQSSLSHTLTFTHDALGRNLSQAGPLGTVSYGYDLAGRRTSMTYPGATALVIGHSYNVAGDLTEIRENPAGSNTLLATYTYDDRGRPALLTRGNGTTTTYTYDNVSRMTQLVENLSGSTYDQTLTFGYNPASQIATNTRSNDNYAWGGHYAVNRAYTANGLNQYTAAGGVTPTYDTRGNLTVAGGATFTYSSENMLVAATGGVTLTYDPLLRLYETVGGSTTRMFYDGQSLIAEYNGSNTLQRRYVHGPGTDEPLVWYEGTGLATRRYYHADERGSIVATSDGSGALVNINSYDEYGIPGSGNTGRFQYTGQQWIDELGMYHYRARIYSPTLGRFLQTDPIGYAGGMNLYAYVGNDPVNYRDPAGTCRRETYRIWWFTPRGEPIGPTDRPSWDEYVGCDGIWNPGDPGPLGELGGGANGDDQQHVIVTGPRRTQRPNECQLRFLERELARRRLPTRHLRNVRFVSGRDNNAGHWTNIAWNSPEGYQAVTQGNTIYVRSSVFTNVANFLVPLSFEEIVHTAQFEEAGSPGRFYYEYGVSGLGGRAGSMIEAFAMAASHQMADAYRSSGCS